MPLIALAFMVCSSFALAQDMHANPDVTSSDRQFIDRAIQQARILQEQAAKNGTPQTLDIRQMPGGLPKGNPEALANLMAKQHDTASTEKVSVIAFVSTSIPAATLKAIGADMAKVGGVMVLRGIRGQLGQNNSLHETMRFLEPVSATGVSIQIDPTLFRRFKVDRVPAYVITGNSNACGMPTTAQCASDSQIVLGDVSLQFALEEIVKHGGPYAEVAANLILRLDNSY